MRAIRITSVAVIASLAGLLAPSAAAQVVRQLTDVKTVSTGQMGALDDAGSTVYINTNTDLLGVNPAHRFQVLGFDAVSGAGTALTNLADGVVPDATQAISVSDDGQWIAFISRSDPLGGNHDQSAEVFVIRDDGTQLAQVTSDAAPNAGSVWRMALAGSGNRIAFVSNSDPLGTNPGNLQQLFVIDRDGTGLVQATTLTDDSGILKVSISDDGTRIVFSHRGDPTGGNADGSTEVFAIQNDGSNLRQLTASSQFSGDAVISGDGSTVAFISVGDLTGGNAMNRQEVFAVDWSGANTRQLTTSTGPFGETRATFQPSITDDGQTVYFVSDQAIGLFPGAINADASYEIFKVGGNGAGLTAVTDFLGSIAAQPEVSGGGTRVSFTFTGGECDSGSGSNINGQLCVMDGNGANVVKLYETDTAISEMVDVTPDGSKIVFVSSTDLAGGDPDATGEMFAIDRDGSGLAQVTDIDTGGRPEYPSIAGDNSTIVFAHAGNDDGLNPDINMDVWKIRIDGTGFQRLTNASSGDAEFTMISADGSKIVFSAQSDLTGGNADLSSEIFAMNPDGSGVVQLTSQADPAKYATAPRVDDSGTWVAFAADADLTGGNADGSWEVFRVRTDGSQLQQISDDQGLGGHAGIGDASGDGTLIAFPHSGDLLGTNPEKNRELFLYDTTTATLTQLTSTPSGDTRVAKISGDGAFIYFASDSAFTESSPNGEFHAFRYRVSDGSIDRIGGLAFGDLGNAFGVPRALAINDDGAGIAFCADGDFVGMNADFNRELYAIDGSVAPLIHVGGGAESTMIEWDVESGPLRYDVLRGDVATLAAGGDLGPSVCVEDDSPDNDTVGFEDDVPLPGQVLFYVYRGSQGTIAGPGSYGKNSAAEERFASSGGCNP